MPDDATLRFYAENAEVYAGRQRQLDEEQLNAFLAAVPAGGDVLELGTGGGQDAAYMLSAGFAVTPSDASPELAAAAEILLGRPVKLMAFNQLDAVAAYDGVWASAALLHAPASELTDDIARIHRALRPGGHLAASFKAGTGEGRDALGRYYNYFQQDQLISLWQASACWRKIEAEAWTGSAYDRKPADWLAITAMK